MALRKTWITYTDFVTHFGISLMIKYERYLLQTVRLRDGHYY